MIKREQEEGRPGENDGKSLADMFFRLAFFMSAALLIFVLGAILTAADTFPGPQIARAYEGGKAFYAKVVANRQIYSSDLWQPERRAEKGVITNLPARVQNGVTLYTSGHEAAAFLIGMDGQVLHEWRRPFSTVWHEGAPIKQPQPDVRVYFKEARVYPNGDLVAVYEGNGDTPYGYGVVKLDRDSNLIWSYFGRAHHDLDIGPDGRIYTLTNEIAKQPLQGFENIKSPRLDDFLVVLSPDGAQLKKLSLIRLVEKSRYRQLLKTVSWFAVQDPLHTNNVDYITEDMAAKLPFARPGQILVSFRELDAIGIVDPDTEELVWATRGPWIGQHDPDILPNGHMLLFDNYGNFDSPKGGSRVIEFDPRTMKIAWQYGGTADRPLDSSIRSSQQRLPNGNTFINESNGGRLLEVTPEGEVAWEFVNPVRSPPVNGQTLTPVIASAHRLDPKDLDPSLLQPKPQSDMQAKEPQS